MPDISGSGLWGVLAVGLFADGTYGAGWNGVPTPVRGIIPALLDGVSIMGDNGPMSQLGAQMIDVGVGFAWAFGITYLIFITAKRFMQVRVSAEVEIEGTDEGELGQVCYPEFVIRAETHGDDLDAVGTSERSSE